MMKRAFTLLILFFVSVLCSKADDWQKVAQFEGGMTGKFFLSKNGSLITNSGFIDPFYSASTGFSSWNKIAPGVDIAGEYYISYSYDKNGNEAIIISGNDSAYRRFTLGGDKWETFDMGKVSADIRHIRFFPLRYGRLLAAGSYSADEVGGLYSSDDNGSTFTKIMDSFFSYDFNVYQDYDSTIYAINNNILARLNPGTLQWDTLSLNLNGLSNVKFASNSEYVFIYSGSMIYRSSDKGLNWETVKDGLPEGEEYSLYILTSRQDGTMFTATLFYDNNYNLVPGKIYMLAPGESTWKVFLDTMDHSINDMIEVPGKGLFISNSLGVMFSSDEGKTWDYINKGINGQLVGSCSVSGNIVNLGTLSGDMLHSEDSGSSWEKTISDAFENIKFSDLLFANNGNLVARSYKGLFFSHDKGKTWARAGIADSLGNNVNQLFLARSGEFFAASYGFLSRSTDNGETWQLIGNFGETSIKTITEDDDGNIILSIQGQESFDFVRLDKDLKITKLALADGLNAQAVYCSPKGRYMFIRGDQESNTILFTFFMTSNNGVTWDTSRANMDLAMEEGSIFNYNVDNECNFYLSTIKGLYKMPWRGKEFVNDLPAEKAVTYIRMQDHETLVCGTINGAIYKKQSLVSVQDDKASSSPVQQCLVSPNPASNFAELSFSAPDATRATIEVYSESGSKVISISENLAGPGEQKINLDVSRLSSGVYSYIIHAGKTSFSGRFCVAR